MGARRRRASREGRLGSACKAEVSCLHQEATCLECNVCYPKAILHARHAQLVCAAQAAGLWLLPHLKDRRARETCKASDRCLLLARPLRGDHHSQTTCQCASMCSERGMHLVGVEHDGLAHVAALLRADGERINGRLHVRVLCVDQQPRVALLACTREVTIQYI